MLILIFCPKWLLKAIIHWCLLSGKTPPNIVTNSVKSRLKLAIKIGWGLYLKCNNKDTIYI